MVCVRRAWLTLGAATMALEDETAGYYCKQLDLGYPEVREVTNNRPDQDGIDDRTSLWGKRAVTADIVATGSPTNTPDSLAAQFGRFMLPSARPVLHYVLDRPGAPERVLTVRAADYSWPISGAKTRAVQLAWVAADPVARDPTAKTVTAWAGTSALPGRVYNLTFNRTYPPGGGQSTTGQIFVTGDVPVKPLLRIYGPITSPWVNLWSTPTGALNYTIYLTGTGLIINAGQWIDIDTASKTAYWNSDRSQSAATSINWTASTWPTLTPQPQPWFLTLNGSSTSTTSQVQAIWQEGYLE